MRARPLHVPLRPSRALPLALGAAHLGAAAAIAPLDLPAGAVVALLACVAGSLVHAGRAGRAAARITGLDVADGEVRVRCRGRPDYRAEVVHGGTVSHPWLVLLCLRRADGRIERLSILPDMARRDDLRRLRIRLAGR